MGVVTVAGIDPSLRNTGIAICCVDTEENRIVMIDRLILCRTKTGPKNQRKSSADYEAALVIQSQLKKAIEESKARVVFAEIPSGSQSSRGTMSAGISIGIMASLNPKPIEVTPQQVKLQSCGILTATKGEMIEWAAKKYPNAEWHMKVGKFLNTNEHLADAIAVIHAGLVTPQWEVIRSLL